MHSKQNHSQDALTREDIRNYQTSTDQKLKNSIERKAASNDFDSDALEGWSESGVSLAAMKRLDRKFSRSWNGYLAVVLLGILPISLLVLFFFAQNKEQIVSPAVEKVYEVQIEKTDILVPEIIESMDELPAKEQIQLKQVIKDFQEQQNEVKPAPASPELVDQLPIKPIDQTISPKPEKELVFGKEIFLKDLKVIDYRSYRSKPTISTEQLTLSGTPADRGEKQSSTEEELTWKSVDVPYMDYLEKSMELFSRGNNKKALTRFEEILKAYPDDINALFYAGLCFYNLKEYHKAIEAFSKCQVNKFANFNEEAQWYHARSFLATGDKDKAKQLLREIIDAKGFYAKQAEKLLKN
jgi:TolA-binding protein